MKNSQLLVEFLGTFFLVLAVACTANPIAIGSTLMIMVYAFGHISGAHFNPAVTFAMLLQQKITQRNALLYVIAQFTGGIAATITHLFLHKEAFLVQPASDTSFLTALIVEIIFTFLLVTTILHVAEDKRVKGNNYFGLAIGGALFIGATIGGPISGGAFNPVVGIAPWLVNFSAFPSNLVLLVLYIVGPLVGAGLASSVYSFTQKK